MKNGGEGVYLTKQVMLDANSYGYWKARMKQTIRGINEDAWTATEFGWNEPTKETEKGSGVFVIRPKSEWTEDEKKLSKYNSRALTAIFCAVEKDQFQLIQHCETAKEAWDTLQKSFEGTTDVKRTRIDTLASQFENLRMEESETITEFSSKISSIANEAHILGKKYKDKKLVKKLLRCLPERFAAYKAAMTMSKNTDELKFCDVVGMLKSHEMENQSDTKTKGIALTAAEVLPTKIGELENMIGMLAKRFDRAVKKGEVPQKQLSQNRRFSDGNRGVQKTKAQCEECKGYGHTQSDCPTTRRREIKCFECRGIGHTQKECIGDKFKDKEKSLLGMDGDESEEDDSDEEVMNNFVAFFGITDYVEEDSESDAETVYDESRKQGLDIESEDDEHLNVQHEYQIMCETLLKIGKEKVALEDINLKLQSEVEELRKECLRMKEFTKEKVMLELQKFELQSEVDKLTQELITAKEEAHDCRCKLKDQTERIDRLGGTKKLDEIWRKQFEQPPWSHRGLGYVNESKEGHSTQFVSKGFYNGKVEVTHSKKKEQVQGSCFYCGKLGHYKAYCWRFKKRVDALWCQGKYYASKIKGCILVKKSDLYGTSGRTSGKEKKYEQCNMAIVIEDESVEEPWYFDSGCSQHMTGRTGYLQDPKSPKKVEKVVFGDGSQGNIRGKGDVTGSELPQLVNVYLVEGLKMNLISVGKLCDQGLEVCFTKVDCRVVDVLGNVIMRGIRTGNNCYMWKHNAEESCDDNTPHAKKVATSQSGQVKEEDDSSCVSSDSILENQTHRSFDSTCGLYEDLELFGYSFAVSVIEPAGWNTTIQEELEFCLNNNVWTLVSRPEGGRTNRIDVYLGNSLVSWLGINHTTVSHVIAESTLFERGSWYTQIAMSVHVLANYGMISESWLVLCDNFNAVGTRLELTQQSCSNHIDIRDHFIREFVGMKIVRIEHGATEVKLACLFTKPVDFNRFVILCKAIGVCHH